MLRTKSSVVKDGHAGAFKIQRVIAATKRSRAKGKLNEQAAVEIRASDETLTVLAERYGVHFSLISKVKTGQAWREFGGNPFAGLGARA